MTLFQYEVFHRVAENKSFTRAAEELHVSQSAISHAVKSLETELGLPLFVRNKGGVHLTKFGEKMLPYAIQMLRLSQSIREEASMEKDLLVGSIAIGSFPSASFELLPHLIKRFHREYPAISISVMEGGYEEIRQWLKSGRVDIGLLDRPDGFETIAKYCDEYQLIVPKGHLFEKKEEVDVQALHEMPFVMPLSGCERVLNKLFAANNVAPKIVMEAEFTPTVVAMVKSGLGVSVIPSFAPTFEGVRMVTLRPVLYREFSMVIKSMESSSPAVKRWIELMRRA